MAQRTTKIELTQHELDEMLRDAAAEGAKQMAEQLKEKVAHLNRSARVEAGVITMRDICTLYDVCPNTVRNWGIEPIDYRGQMNLYRVEDLADQIEGE